MPGNTILAAGEVVHVSVPSLDPSKGPDDVDTEELLDDFLTGKYLITSVRHIIKESMWTSYVEISKDSHNKPLSDRFAQGYSLE